MTREEKKTELLKLITQAFNERKWIHLKFNDLWFSPSELEHLISNDHYIYDVENFELQEPSVLIEKVEQLKANEEPGSVRYQIIEDYLAKINERIEAQNHAH